ncbi:MAG: pyridoxamine 5'-phosphate oxidase family protein [Nocardioides sp.]
MTHAVQPPAGGQSAKPEPMRLTRKPDRGRDTREALNELLDEVLVGTLSTIVDGWPHVVPMLFARDADRVLLHGSTGAGALRAVAAGAPAALCVVSVDGLVVAESTFESSANYRSGVIRGHLQTIEGEEAWRVLDALSDRLLPGRNEEVAPMTRKQVAATLALALPITDGNWLYKERTGGPGEPEEETDAWCGVLPLRLVAGDPVTAPWSQGVAVPESVRRAAAQWVPTS